MSTEFKREERYIVFKLSDLRQLHARAPMLLDVRSHADRHLLRLVPAEVQREAESAGGQVMTLPNDIARCAGVGNDEEGWREGCDECMRRTSPSGEMQLWMEPPPIIVFECEYRIEPK